MCVSCAASATQAGTAAAGSGGIAAMPALLGLTALIGLRLFWGYQVERIRNSRPLQIILVILALAIPVALLFATGIL